MKWRFWERRAVKLKRLHELRDTLWAVVKQSHIIGEVVQQLDESGESGAAFDAGFYSERTIRKYECPLHEL